MEPSDDRTALALTMWGEARGEGMTGMQCVGNVIMNRAAAGDWRGKTPLQVCLKPYQFSCWNAGDPNRAILLALTEEDEPNFAEVLDLADKLLAGEVDDLTDGANAYYAEGSPVPDWANGNTPCHTEGHHLFFSNIP
jgi:N-acetylmuramoyl-L-alanine amidase